MKKTIRTMQGKQIDFEELALRNEHVSAVGNMNVNAAGDELEKIKPSATKARSNKKAYRRQIQKKVSDMPIMDSKRHAEIYAAKMAREYVAKTKEILEPTVDTTEIVDQADAIMGKAVIQTAPPMPTANPREHKDNEVSNELLQDVLNRPKGGGLANAIAKAQDVKHGPIKSPREQLRATDGVTKI